MKRLKTVLLIALIIAMSLLVSCAGTSAAGTTTTTQSGGASATTAAANTTSAKGSAATATSAAGATTTIAAAATTTTTTTAVENFIGIREIISAEEVGAILGQKPSSYEEIVKPSAVKKIGTYRIGNSTVQTDNLPVEIGILIGLDTVKKYGYRDPATPRYDSEITAMTILGAPAYLDAQFANLLIDGKTIRQVTSYQLITINNDVYYYLNTGASPGLATVLPTLMEKLIQNARVKIH